MIKKPLISVLMPVYNAEKYLYEAIESVLSQTFKDFEFLIIDDGSTDNSVDLIRSFSDPRMRFYQNEKNLGITPTLNRGIELAGADLIARMDADDICYPERLQKQYDFIESHPDGTLYACWAMEVTANREPIIIERFNPDHLYYNTTFSMWFYHPTLIYRREAVMSVGKYTISYCEDYELVWQLSRKFKVYLQPEVLLEYRHTDQSLWKVTEEQNYKETYLKQVRRNIQYYLEDTDIQLEDWHVEYMVYADDFRDQPNMVHKIVDSTRLLDLVTAKILQKENVNRNPEAIKAAAQEKREYSLLLFISHIGHYKKLMVLIRTRSWKLLAKLIFGWVRKMCVGIISRNKSSM